MQATASTATTLRVATAVLLVCAWPTAGWAEPAMAVSRAPVLKPWPEVLFDAAMRRGIEITLKLKDSDVLFVEDGRDRTAALNLARHLAKKLKLSPEAAPPVEVVVTGRFRAASASRPDSIVISPAVGGRSDDPILVGASAAHQNVSAGTLGCIVRRQDGLYALGNYHTFAAMEEGRKGEPIVSPARGQRDGRQPEAIARLEDFERLDLTAHAQNTMDAAVAKLLYPERLSSGTQIAGRYGAPRTEAIQAQARQPVMKYGAATKLSRGTVCGTAEYASVWYGDTKVHFVDQIVISGDDFARAGDSGSLVVVADCEDLRSCPDHRRPVGLVFAASDRKSIEGELEECPGNRLVLANPISVVLKRFQATIEGQAEGASSGTNQP